MIYCNNCNYISEEPNKIEENMGECFGFPCVEQLAICPHCGSEDITEAIKCKICEEYVPDSTVEYGACENCRREVNGRFMELMRNNFYEVERELLNDIYDGECF